MIPSPSLTPPALADYQMSFRGLTFGGVVPGSAYQLQGLKGIDMPPVMSGDVQRALDQGEFAGLDLSGGRDVEVTLVINPDGTSLDHARQALAGVLAVGGNTEEPLYLQLPSGVFACMARPRKYAAPVDITTVLANGCVSNALLHATDPRWYAMPTKTATVGLPEPLGGVSFPISFDLSFGGGSTGGLLTVENNGTFECRPIFTITGPCTNPVISNLSIPGAPSLGFNITLGSGDTLVVETDYQSILYTPAGASGGASRRGSLMTGSTWWNLSPGSSTIEFTTSDGTQVSGTLTVVSADSFMGL
jgi:hypothetical protein